MLLIVPTRDNAEMKNFICDLITQAKPNLIFTNSKKLLHDLGSVSPRYNGVLNDVSVFQETAVRCIELAKEAKGVKIVLLDLLIFKQCVARHPELRKFIKRHVLYPAEYELRCDINLLAHFVSE